jgi:hypothetical protein
VFDRFCTQHQVREIKVPNVWWRVWALGHVAKITQVALINDFVVIFLVHAMNFTIFSGIDQIK